MDEGEESRSKFIITDGNATELIEPEKEVFHKMAFFMDHQ